MLVLGLNYGDHDPSAALIEDGKILSIIEHERVSRTKRGKYQTPTESIIACMKATGATAGDVGAVAIGWDDEYVSGLNKDVRWHLENVLPGAFSRLPHLPPVVCVRHHLAHAASAYWCSGFHECAVMVVDGQGERESTTLWWGKPSGLVELRSYPDSLSLGHFYKAATKYSGLEQDGGNYEGKFMGLAAYGRATEPMPLVSKIDGLGFSEGIEQPAGARVRESLRDQLHAWWAANTYPFSSGDGREIMAYANFAASVQSSLEEALVRLARMAKDATGSSSLAIAGGVGQNCAANGVLAARRVFDEMYVQPACHDAGVSVGAALVVSHQRSTSRPPSRAAQMRHAYWGQCYTPGECQAALDSAGLKYRRHPENEIVSAVSQLIADGDVVGWFHGRAEVGPRALGARSILADPRKRSNLVRLNGIKSREVWRPLAPSVLEEHFDDYFASSIRSPFMNVACPVREPMRSRIPAVVHVDGTARPQSVCRKDAPRYWSLIDSFRNLTGVPVLINTSFNLRNEPIVNTPRDAIRDFMFSPIDVLVLEDFLVTKEANS